MRTFRPSAFRSFARFAVLSLALLGAMATQISCGGGGGGGGSTGGGGGKTLSSIAITPASPQIAAGTFVQLKATGHFSDGSTSDLSATATWSSATSAVATVSSSGLVSGLVAGSSVIKATSGSISATVTLTVTNATLTSLSLSPSNPVVAKGATQAFTATGHFSDATTQDLSAQATWLSSSSAIATITPAGVATGVAAGSATISASLGAVSASTGILVTPGASVTLSSIALSPSTPTIAKATSLQFKAIGTFSDASTADVSLAVTWSSATTSVATINASGLATGVAAGTSAIGAANGAVSGSTVLTVTNATLVSIAVAPANAVIPVAGTKAYTATGTFSDATTQNLTGQVAWSSSSTATATINAAGLATGVAAGSTTITATKGAVSGSTKLTVTGTAGVTLVSLAVTPANAKIAASTSLQYKATGTFSDASTLDLTGAVAWSSSATAIATIDAAGLASGLSAGATTITASAGSISGSTGLTVSNATLSSIAVTPINPVIPVAGTQAFTATGSFSDGSTQNLSSQVLWASSSTATATINAAGLATGVAAGATTISATKGAVSGSTQLTVTATAGVTLVSLAVTPANPSIAATTSQQFTATGTFSDGSKQNLTAAVAWSSSSAATATINAAGLATGVAAGTTTITATAGLVNANTTLTVTAATLSSIAVTPVNPKIAKNTGLQFKATGTFSDATTQDLTAQVAWSSSATATATINVSGFASGVAAGTTTISATKGAVSGSTTLTVTNATLVSIAVTPANSSVAKGATKQFTATGTFSDATTQNLSTQVAWTSSSAAVATINSTGLASGLSTGTTTIKAAFGAVSGSTFLTVTPPAGVTLNSIAVTPNPVSIAKGTTQAFVATGSYSDGSSLNLSNTATWSSSSSAVATVSATGLAKGTGVGSATITAAFGAVSGNASLTVTSATLTSIAISPLTPSIAAGTSQQFTATGTFSDGTKQNISATATWSSSSTAAATINGTGLATGVAAGTTTITATSGAFSQSTTLTVTSATLVSIAVTPANGKLAAGFTQAFTATGTFSDASTQNLTGQVIWASSSTAAATIDAAGLATGVAAGATTISATKGAVVGSTGLTVTNATLVSIAVTPANSAIVVGGTRQFTATGTFSDASKLNLTTQVAWNSSSAAVATIDGAGLATGAATGTTTIKATNGAISGSTFLTVTPAGAILSSINVTPVGASIAKGTSQAFTATAIYSNAPSQNITNAVTWASSSTAVATIATTGVAKGTGVGSTTISATLGAVTGSTTLTVTPATLTSMAITPLTPSVAAGTSQQFTATGTFSDGTKQNISATAAWSSSSTATATIDAAGLASGLAAGTTTITATSGALSASTVLTVTNATLVSIAVTPANAKLPAGFTRQYTATGTFSDASTQDLTGQVTWSSSNTLFASIDAAGLTTGVAPGSVTISAAFGAVSGSTGLTVTNATLVAIAVAPINSSIVQGGTRQFTATGTFSDASTLPMTTQVTWASSNTAVATIASSGLATGVGAGTATISATSGSILGSTSLTVTAASVTLVSIAVAPPSATLNKGQSQAYTATGVYSDGSTQNLTLSVTWASSATSVATINGSGVAKSVGVGSATITATSGAVVGSASLTVNPAALVSMALSPLNPSAAAGTSVQFTAMGTYTDGSKVDLSATAAWGSSNNAAATISTTGLASALAAGTTTISATSGAVSASTTLTVSSATLVSIAVTPASAKIAASTGRQFIATGTFSDASTQNLSTQVIWNSSNTAAATINTTGFASGLSAGVSTITATSGAVSGTATLTVTNATLSSLAVTPVNGTVVKGATKQYAATGTFSDGTTQVLTTQVAWASSAPAVASISTTGLATGVGVGTTTISATFGAVTGGTFLTVMPSGVSLAAINVTPSSAAIPKGTTKAFTATGVYSDGSSQNLSFATTWASSDTTVASVTNIGVAKGLLVGSSTISATFGAISGAASLTVTPAALVSLAITPANPSIAAGTQKQFTATGTFSDGSKLDVTATVTWNSATTATATIDTAGLASGVAAGTSVISATSGAISASTTLTVTNATLVSIAVTPANPTIAATTGLQFKATGTFSDASTQDLTTQVTWSSSLTGVATIDGIGFATGVAAGSTSISATFGAVSGSTSLTVTSATLVSIAVTPANSTLQKNATKQFTAIGTFSDASTQDLSTQVQWASFRPWVATIDSAGLATGISTGLTDITAQFGSVLGGTPLTVVPPAGVNLVSIAVTPPSTSVTLGFTMQFTATGTFSDGSSQDLSRATTWTSSNGTVASVDNTGLATSLAAGTSIIKATLGAINGSATLTVASPSLISIFVTPANSTIAKTTTQQFTATGHYNDGSTADLTATATWSSSNTGAATISTTGLATGIAAGTTTIQATSGAVSGSTSLTVTGATLVSLAVTPVNAVIPAGSSQQFTALGTFSDTTTQDLSGQVTWSSSATAVATISGSGLATGLAKGSTTISAAFGAVSGSTSLTVSATSAALVSIVVTPPAPHIAAGTTQQFVATGVFADSTTQDLSASSAWTSSVPAVATVSGTGLATSLTAGLTTISATANGITGNAALTVTTATLTSISVSPAGRKIAAGTTLQYTATGTFSDGSIQNLTSLATWNSSATSAATISVGGLATGVAAGSTTISATIGAVTGSTTLTVTNATLSSITIGPVDPSIAKGTTQLFQAEGLFSDGSKQDLSTQVTWGSTNTTTATITLGGVATGLQVGTTTITATFGAVSGSTTLTVTPATLSSIAVTPTNPSAPAGFNVQFTATGTFSDGSNQNLTSLVSWTSTATSVATVDPTGLAVGLIPGSADITATLGAVSGSTTLTITNATLSSITLDPPAPFLALGSQQQMTATGVFSDGTNLDLTSQAAWSSSTPTVAVVDPAGLVTTPTGAVTGTTTVTATFLGVSGSTVVTVTAATLSSISVFGNTPIGVGTTDPYTATGIYSDGSSVDLTAQATWSSSDTSIATVDNVPLTSGTVTGITAGTATITATFGGISGSASVTVSSATLTSITVTPASQTIAALTTLQYTATGNYSDGSTQDLTLLASWASSNPAAADISSALGTEGLATGIGAGTTTISATFGGVVGSTDLTVTNATLLSIAVTPANSSLPRGFTQQMVATGTFSDGSTQDLSTQATWTSSNTAVAVISNAAGTEGTATALAAGTTTLTATLNGVSGSTGLTVTNVVLVSITVTPANKTITVGKRQKMVATGTFSDGSTKNITSSVTWTSSDPTIARINAGKKGGAGKCIGLAPGTVTITATKPPAAGQPAVSGSTTLTVK